MKRSSSSQVLQWMLLTLAALVVLTVPRQTPLDSRAILGFTASFILLNLLDVWLPQGETADMTAALAIAAVMRLDPLTAAVIASVSRIVAHLLRNRFTRGSALLAALARRLTAIACAAVVWFFMVPPGRVFPSPVDALSAGKMLLVATVLVAVDFLVAQLVLSLRTGRPLWSVLAGQFVFQRLLIAAQLSIGLLVFLIYRTMSLWGLLLSIVLLLVVRQSFLLVIQVRTTYSSTLTALVRAVEVHNPDKYGHSERVSQLSVEAAKALAFHGTQLEAVRYAGLLHDVGTLAADLDNRGAVDGEAETGAATVVEGIRWVAQAKPILQLCDSPETVSAETEAANSIAAYIVSRMSNYDDARWGQRPDKDGIESLLSNLGKRRRIDIERAIAAAIDRDSHGMNESA